jgi:hypothetical protein
LARVSADTLAPSVNVRDTAERDTPASSATRLALTDAFFGFRFDLAKAHPDPCTVFATLHSLATVETVPAHFSEN